MVQIAKLFSIYFEKGFFPREGKTNVLVNIPKKETFSPEQSRPIALTPVMQRV